MPQIFSRQAGKGAMDAKKDCSDPRIAVIAAGNRIVLLFFKWFL